MADTYTWKISTLNSVIADGGIYLAHWALSAARDVTVNSETKTYSASTDSTQGFNPDPTAPDYIPYTSVTEAEVIAWVKAQLGTAAVTDLEENLTKRIDLQITPVDTTGVPW